MRARLAGGAPGARRTNRRPGAAAIVAAGLFAATLAAAVPPPPAGAGQAAEAAAAADTKAPGRAAAIPDQTSLRLAVLEKLADGAETPLSELRNRIAEAEGLTPEDRARKLPSGRHTVFSARVGWAVFVLKTAGLVQRVRRGVYRLTDDGKELLAREPGRIGSDVLRDWPAFVEWENRQRRRSPNVEPPPPPGGDTRETPEEAMERAAAELRARLEAEVLDRVRDAEPEFLEQVVIDLLIEMGYGGGDAAMGEVTGGSGDGGIDGMIREDVLGLEKVYVQAKRYAPGNKVGESDLRDFVGAIVAVHATKGVFVTTSEFTEAAERYAERSPKRVVLIDGDELARLMVTHGVGVRTRVTHRIKWIDEDYFDKDAL